MPTPLLQPAAAGLLFLALMAAAGLPAADLLLPNRVRFERRALGLLFGFALLLIASFLATSLHAPLAALPALAISAVATIWLRRRALPRFVEARGSPWTAAGIGLLFAVILAWFAVPVLSRMLPQGWDPSFHVSATEIIARGGHIPDTWAPYEPSEKFDYPPALHCAMALFTRLSGLTAARVFSLTLVLVAALTLPLIFLIGARCGGAGAGALATIAYGLTAGWGTFVSHALWGGLPNLAGLALLWALLIASFEPWAGAVLFATVCAIAIALLHHLSFAILGFTVFTTGFIELVSERRVSPPTRAAVFATLLAAGSAGLLVILRPSGRFSLYEAFHLDRDRLITIARAIEVVGLPVVVVGLLGLLAALFTRSRPQRLLADWTIALLAYWVLWDWLYRWGAIRFAHRDFTAVAPSRGLTDAAVLLAVLGGILVWRIVGRLPLPGLWIAALLALALWHDWKPEQERFLLARRDRGTAVLAEAFCREVRARTPADAVLFAPDFGDIEDWMPYLCDREFNYFPDPGYATSGYRDAKMRQRDPLAFARFIRKERQRPTYYATWRLFYHGRLVLGLGGWRLYEVTP